MSKVLKPLTDEEKQIILQLNKNGYNTVYISKQIGRDNSTVGRFLKRNGLKANWSKTNLSNQDKEDIIKLYSQGLCAREILEKYCDKVHTENTIMSIVKNVGIGRNRGCVTNGNIDYFDNIDSEEKAYFLGLLLTDGNLHRVKRNTEQYIIQISLKLEDIDIIKKFQHALNSTNKVRIFERGNRKECMFGISSKKLAFDLMKWGVTPVKTFKTELNFNIPKNLFHHYVRGIFDGDGTVFISKGRLRFGFYGTHKLVSQVQDWLISQINISNNKVFDKETVSFVVYQRPKDVKNFYDLIYKDASIYLKRKKDKFDNYLKAVV